jgi:hypothetical protein
MDIISNPGIQSPQSDTPWIEGRIARIAATGRQSPDRFDKAPEPVSQSHRDCALESLAELPELLDQAKSLREVWDVAQAVLEVKQQAVLDLKSQELALSAEPDLLKRAEKSMSLPVARKWAEAEVTPCQQEASSARRALEVCVIGIHALLFNAAKYLRQDYIETLCGKARALNAKLLGQLYDPDVLRLVLSCSRLAEYTNVEIPFREDIEIGNWITCFSSLKKLAEH